jgi:hypothetical protein
MNWDQLEGKWKQYKGNAKEKWGKFVSYLARRGEWDGTKVRVIFRDWRSHQRNWARHNQMILPRV